MSVKDTILQRIREIVAARKLTDDEVARLAIPKKHARTIKRLLAGETMGWDTIEAVERGLAGLLAQDRQQGKQDRDGAGRGKMEQDGAGRGTQDRDGPVWGWEQAAIVLGVSRWTLKRRRDAGPPRVLAWWSSRAALRAWFDALAGACVEQDTPERALPASEQEGA